MELFRYALRSKPATSTPAWSGRQVQGLAHGAPTVAELMVRIMRKTSAIIERRLRGFVVAAETVAA